MLLLLLLLLLIVIVVSLWIDRGNFVSPAWICAAFVDIDKEHGVKGPEASGHSTLVDVAQLSPEHVARRRVGANCGRVAKKVNEKNNNKDYDLISDNRFKRSWSTRPMPSW